MKIKYLTSRLAMLVPENRIPNPHTFKLRKAMIRANITMSCAMCSITNSLDAHHIKPVKYLKNKQGNSYQDPQGDHSALNGQWLCRPCHRKIHHNPIGH